MKKLFFLLCFSFSAAQASTKGIAAPALLGQEVLQPGGYSAFIDSFEGIAKFTVYSLYNDPEDGLNLQFDDQESMAHIVHDDQGGVGVMYDEGFPEDLKNIEARMTDINKIEIVVKKWNVLTRPELKVRFQAFTAADKSVWVGFQSPLTPLFVYGSAVQIPVLLNAPDKVDTLKNWLSPLTTQILQNAKTRMYMRVAISFVTEISGQPVSTPVVYGPLMLLTEDSSAQISGALYAWYHAYLPALEGGKFVISISLAPEQGQIFYINNDLEVPAANLLF
ncbi:hypothetical protein [Bdellovibrio sp. NC01]|uniref:hypothetical protein n=1 Tax=Bdellovibrio sp. NC01 TaxID=2220073 RepID=UPI001157BEA1|nr:hypothetical protein [Bdellovibrio sp. NC01]QDK38062.1 hypothetical protein DOE51_10915 [Bdellovibrio sp. NC01]